MKNVDYLSKIDIIDLVKRKLKINKEKEIIIEILEDNLIKIKRALRNKTKFVEAD